MIRPILIACACAFCSMAETVVSRRMAVQIDASGNTIPPESIATPQQVDALSATAAQSYDAATGMSSRASACADRVRLYSTNYLVTSTVYVQSIGGVPYDASNQVIRIVSFTASPSEIQIVGTVRQTPLVPPALDFRAAIDAGAWTNLPSTVSQVPLPEGVTNSAAAYRFTLPRPGGPGAYFRIVDNSTGASGSGLWWVVFGGITVDGHRGRTAVCTNVVGAVTNSYRFVGGILVEPNPIGEF